MLEIYGATESKYEMKVLNVYGSEVLISQITESQNRLNFSHLPNGMYYLVLTNDKVKLIEKFVIAK